MALSVVSFVLALPASLIFIGAPWCPLAFAQSGQVLPVCASCAITPLPWWAALLAVVAGVALIVDIISAALGVRLLTMVAMMGSGLLVFVYLAAMFLFISDSPALYAASASTPDLHCRGMLMAARERMHASGAMFGFVCAARGAMLALFIRLRRIDKRSPTGIATVSSPPRRDSPSGDAARDRWTLRGYTPRSPLAFRSSYAEL